jgi:hypothetical protein
MSDLDLWLEANKVPVDALTGQLDRPKKHMSGYPTYRALERKSALLTEDFLGLPAALQEIEISCRWSWA